VGATDLGGRILQRRARVLVLGSAFFVLPVLVLELVTTWLTFDRFESLEGAVVSLPELAGGIEAATGVETLLWYLGLVANSLAVALVGGLATVVALDDRAGRRVTLAGSLIATVRRAPTLVLAWFIGHSWVVVASLVMVNVDGLVLAGLAFVASPVLLAVVALMLMVSPIVIAERAGPITAVRRSFRLSRARWGATTAFVVVSGLVGLWVRFGVTFLPRLAEMTGLVTFGSAGWLVEGAAGQIARLLAIPLVAVATAACYIEIRMQVEGVDLTAEADRAFRARR
jgi:MFS family permease